MSSRVFCQPCAWLPTALILAILCTASANCAEPSSTSQPKWTAIVSEEPKGGASAVQFSPDGKIVALATRDEKLKLYDGATLKELPIKVDSSVMSNLNRVAFSPDGKRLATAGGRFAPRGGSFEIVRAVYVWDVETGKKLAEAIGADGSCFAVCFSPDGKLLATGDQGGNVQTWDAATGKLQTTIRGDAVSVRSVAFTHDGKQILWGNENGTVQLNDAATGEKVGGVKAHEGDVRSVIPLKDGKRFASVGTDGKLRIWNLSDRKELRSLDVSPVTQQLRVRPGGKAEFVDQAEINGVSLTADESKVVVGLFRKIKIVDVASGKEVAELVGHLGQLRTVAFAPDGSRVVSGDNLDVRLWTPPKKSE